MRLVKYIYRPVRTLGLFVKVTWPLIVALVWCEYLIYYATLATWCSWPTAPNDTSYVRTVVLSDTHLLGNRRGHPWDKLRREWQMFRSFQTFLTLYQPSIVIILGDVFDEGLIASPEEFSQYTTRFNELFYVKPTTKLIVVVGNHDIGFHDRVLAYDPFLRTRFEKAFQTKLVQLDTYSGINFVTINSMAMEGDGCHLCVRAKKYLKTVAVSLQEKNASITYSRPIVLTHFPLFRKSDELCNELDAAPALDKDKPFLPATDCLSKHSTNFLLNTLKPRLVLTGHTHNGCYLEHMPGNIPEWTVASFSWRNRPNPSFLLLMLTPDKHLVSKCFLPNEKTVVATYIISIVIFIVNLCMWLRSKLKRD